MSNNMHYYGWEYIKTHLDKINTSIKIIDFVDNYFIGCKKTISVKWIGIIHHTNSNYSSNNMNNLFTNTYFIDSLNLCNGLIVLSNSNKEYLEFMLKLYNKKITVHLLKHPMPPKNTNKNFNINEFEKNKNIYSIGAWLRNPYTFYHTTFSYENTDLIKNKLKGLHMDNYFPLNDEHFHYNKNVFYKTKHYLHNLYDEFKKADNIINITEKYNEHIQNTSIDNVYSRSNDGINYYNYYLSEYTQNITYKNIFHLNRIIQNNYKSVNLIERVNDDAYLEILTSSIVFCNYIDCAASNTIVECISTNTPIILNKLPAIIEYLGEDYPLYIENLKKVDDCICITKQDIVKTNRYLIQLNKNDLHLNHFIDSIKNIIQTIPFLTNKYYYYIKKKMKN